LCWKWGEKTGRRVSTGASQEEGRRAEYAEECIECKKE
jgi:hypothetical protein